MYEGYGNNYATHVIVIEDGLVKAKLNDQERVRHSNIDCYYKYTDNVTQDSFGVPYSIFIDAFA